MSVRFRRPPVLDLIAVALLAAGLLLLATGALPVAQAHATFDRILPLLVFLAAVIVLAELASTAELFDVIAVRITILGRGRTVAMFGLCFAFAALTTIFLNLDTTAVLLTPVMLAAAARAGIARLPLAMTTVWLASLASLLLPVSNLTNLLAANRIGLEPVAFAERMALPQLAALVVGAAALWLLYWRHADRRYTPPERLVPANRATFTVAAISCTAFIAAILAGISITIAALACAGILVITYALRDRAHLTWRLLPWRLLVFVTGLFLVMDTLSEHGLSTWMTDLIGTAPGTGGMIRAAATGATASNLLNNLPVYVAGESVIPPGNHGQLIALLIGTNLGPLVTPWAALATLLWWERCRSAGLEISWRRFVATGTVTAIAALAAAVAVLILAG